MSTSPFFNANMYASQMSAEGSLLKISLMMSTRPASATFARRSPVWGDNGPSRRIVAVSAPAPFPKGGSGNGGSVANANYAM